VAEEYARDSFENLLYSICRFKVRPSLSLPACLPACNRPVSIRVGGCGCTYMCASFGLLVS
jgi:hypothetical protein